MMSDGMKVIGGLIGLSAHVCGMLINIYWLRRAGSDVPYIFAAQFFPLLITSAGLGVALFGWLRSNNPKMLLAAMVLAMIHCGIIWFMNKMLTMIIS